MNLTELNDEFEILFEDLATAGSIGLNAYEKSVCYTHVQEQMVKAYAKANFLAPIVELVTTVENSTIVTTSKYKSAKEFARVTDSCADIDYWITSDTIGDIALTPAPEGFIDQMLSGAYKYPPKNLAFVVMGGTNLIVFPPFNYDLKSLMTRYVVYPNPIILEVLTGGETINTETATSLPQIDEAYHRELVIAAVKYAIDIYIGSEVKEVPDDTRRN